MKNSALIRGTVTSATACLPRVLAEEPGKAGRGGRWGGRGKSEEERRVKKLAVVAAAVEGGWEAGGRERAEHRKAEGQIY